MKKLLHFLSIFCFLFTPLTLAQLVGGSVYLINGVEAPPASFQNITTAAAYLSSTGVTGTGQVVIELTTGYTGEPGPVTIGTIAGASATLGVTFRPAAGYTALTQTPGGASPNQHALRIIGSYITLDGRSGGAGTGRNWTVHVTGSGSSGLGQMAVRIDNTPGSITGINIRNLIMIGEAANATGAVFQIMGNTTNTMSNVIVENNLITSPATSSTDTRGYGITIATASNVGNTGLEIRNNDVTNFYARGINLTGGFAEAKYYNNNVYHTVPITQQATLEFSGIYFSSTAVANAGSEIFNNKVYSIQLTNGATAINGIYIFGTPSGGNPVKFHNNIVSLGQHLSGTAANLAVYGMRVNTLTAGIANVQFNSVYVGGEATTGTANSAAFIKSVSNFTSLNNNIFFNARGNNGSTGTHWAIATNNITYVSISNNAYYVTGTGGVLGTTTNAAAGNQSTISEWQAAMGGDPGSIFVNPNFIDPSSMNPNLKINTAIASPLESGAIEIAGITTDFEGNNRYPVAGYPNNPSFPATAPDIGADEFAGQPADISPPLITFDALNHTSSTGNRTLTATITDASGVMTGANGPRLYYKKGSGGSYVIDNSPVIAGDNFTFTLNSSLLGGVVSGDTIFYYLAARDSAGNAGTSPAGGGGINPPGTTPPATLLWYRVVPSLSGTYAVGSGTYPNLTAVANILRPGNSEVGGNVIFELNTSYDGTTETFPIVFEAFQAPDSIVTVTIRPAMGVTARLTAGDPGSGVTLPVIDLNGADRYIFDGRPGGVGENIEWTIRNTRTATTFGAVFRFINEAQYNIIRSLNIESQSTTTTAGLIHFSTAATGEDGNSNNIVHFNMIRNRQDGGSSFAVGVYSSGTAANPNRGNAITDNHFANYTGNAINITTGNGSDWSIMRNHFYSSVVSTSTQSAILMASAGSLNTLISDNFIGGSGPGATGMMVNSGNITVSGISATSGLGTISMNTIRNISGTGTGTATRIQGINVSSTTGGWLISQNNISNLSTTGTSSGLLFGNQAARGIIVAPSGQFSPTSIIANTIDNISVENTGALTASNVAAGIAGYNIIGTPVAHNRISNIRNNTVNTNPDNLPIATGIFLSFGSNIYVINNMVHLGDNDTSNAQFIGITQLGAGTSNVHHIYNNSIFITGSSNGSMSSYGISRGTDTSLVQNQVVRLTNNLVFMNRSGVGATNYPVISRGPAALAGLTSDYNLLINNINPSAIASAAGIGYDFGAWKANSGNDKFSLSPSGIAPGSLFAGPSTGNLLINHTNEAAWYANGNGHPLISVDMDFEGNPRSVVVSSGATDIGADEFTPTSLPPVITVPVTGAGSYNFALGGKSLGSVIVTTQGSLNELNLRYHSGVFPPNSQPGSMNANAFWAFSPNAGASGYSFDMNLHYTEAILGQISSESNLRIGQSTSGGTQWSAFNYTSLDSNANSITSTGMWNNLNSWFTLTDSVAPIPVELSAFTATVDKRDVIVKWTTATETNNAGFELERSIVSENEEATWLSIASINGNGTTTEAKEYSVTDNKLTSGTYNYRLKQIDYNGTTEYYYLSSEVEIGRPTNYELSQNYPNPFNPASKIDYQLPNISKVTIELFSITGERVAEIVNQIQEAGYYTIEVNSTAYQLASGVYIYRMSAVDNVTNSHFINIKKMMLLK
jgi:hypothetical protein